MNLLEGINRLKKNIDSESDPDVKKDLKAVFSGMSNFYFRKNTTLAKQRYDDFCKGCIYNVKEPIESMRLTDKDITELSGRSCGLCGCVLSYKTRQSVKKCPYWK